TSFSRDWSSDVCSSDLSSEERIGVERNGRVEVGLEGEEFPETGVGSICVKGVRSARGVSERIGFGGGGGGGELNSAFIVLIGNRSEERRVGKESMSRGE